MGTHTWPAAIIHCVLPTRVDVCGADYSGGGGGGGGQMVAVVMMLDVRVLASRCDQRSRIVSVLLGIKSGYMFAFCILDARVLMSLAPSVSSKYHVLPV